MKQYEAKPKSSLKDYLNPFSFLKELTIKGNGSLFKPDGSLNLDVYIAYNYERLGFPDAKTFRRDLELEIRKCLLKEDIGDNQPLNDKRAEKDQASKVQ